jgi:hypothetical protein
VGLRVHPREKNKFHNLETSSFAHYKKLKIEPSEETQCRLCSGIVKAFYCLNFSPEETTINSDKYCETLKILCEAIKKIIIGVRLLHDGA